MTLNVSALQMIKDAKAVRDAEGGTGDPEYDARLDAQYERAISGRWSDWLIGDAPTDVTARERGETVERTPSSGMTNHSKPAKKGITEKQLSFVISLMLQKSGSETVVRSFLDLANETKVADLSSKAASDLIGVLLKLANKSVEVTVTQEARQAVSKPVSKPAKVEPGYYALRTSETDDNAIAFYRVTTGKAGSRWEGFTFVAVVASDDTYPVRDRTKREMVLAEIAKDAHGAGQLYGQKIGRCSRCHKTLTDQTSRDYGMGPECRSK